MFRRIGSACLVLGLAALPVGPLTGTGLAQEVTAAHSTEAAGYFAEPHAIAKGIDFAVRTMGDGADEARNGFYPEMGAMITGAGWISIGPGYRHWLFNDHSLVETSAAYSWRGYKAAQARYEFPHLLRSRLALGAQYRWQDLTQVSYFGDGSGSLESDRSEYRLTSHNLVGYASVRTTTWLSIRGRAGWLHSPDLRDPVGHFQRGNPSTLDVFTSDPALLRGTQPNYLHGDLALVADTRDHRSHPVHGGLYRAAWSTYSDRENGSFSFNRYELEAAHFVPLSSERVVLALHGWSAMTDTAGRSRVPFYMEPSLGGNNTLRGYDDYRFHDRHMLVLNAETRIAIFTHLDGALFVDAGNVANVVRELNIDRRSYGFGVRMHSNRSTFARFDVAHGSEGWRFLFKLSDPLHLARLSRRTASAPYVP